MVQWRQWVLEVSPSLFYLAWSVFGEGECRAGSEISGEEDALLLLLQGWEEREKEQI
jgi:hypothetical protein